MLRLDVGLTFFWHRILFTPRRRDSFLNLIISHHLTPLCTCTEEFHSTPETQTDESYNHPEDLEHFAQHEKIEREEAAREAKFQGISVEEAIAAHNHDLEAQQKQQQEQKAEEHANDDNATNGQVSLGDSNVDPNHNHDSHDSAAGAPTGPKIVRTTPPEKQDPAVRFRKAKEEGKVNDEWGVGEGGYKIPKTPGERMRKNVPYKVSFVVVVIALPS